ncbi:uncharacterized protein C8Q71DRAFT_481602 [Rhodofomes roseus]|uniref:C2H2-type domain-containing protein n=1 Tax=Rhodofomes roseus TaxID=34475 RepID=A0ABQ8KP42_9APHY|nr:uncharacterized protein C8Q71DRAFT_481602 [Rhodofomes roseus]KAH9840198.1 hypothetical protein C8Q71DRAFT_481602 [Rhodofomes roseus]
MPVNELSDRSPSVSGLHLGGIHSSGTSAGLDCFHPSEIAQLLSPELYLLTREALDYRDIAHWQAAGNVPHLSMGAVGYELSAASYYMPLSEGFFDYCTNDYQFNEGLLSAESPTTGQSRVRTEQNDETLFNHADDSSTRAQQDFPVPAADTRSMAPSVDPGYSSSTLPTLSQDAMTHLTCMWNECGDQVRRTKNAIHVHLKQVHRVKVPAMSDAKDKIRCDWDGCMLEVHNFWRHLQERHTHVRAVRKPRCEHCGQDFTRPGSLRRHHENLAVPCVAEPAA